VKPAASIDVMSVNDVRPAKTLHKTTMAQLHASSVSGSLQRRTLGVRRSVNGWANRHGQGQGFVVPRRRQV
jgi:hypothetical protein